MMPRMKELEDENRRLKKMYAEERLKAEMVAEAMQKSGKAISETGDGQKSGSAIPSFLSIFLVCFNNVFDHRVKLLIK